MRRLNGEPDVAEPVEATNLDPQEVPPFAPEAETGTGALVSEPAPKTQRAPENVSAALPARKLANQGLVQRKAQLHIDFEHLAQRGFIVPGSPTMRLSEEFQEIKRKLIASMVPGMSDSRAPSNLVMVTSSVPGEGKTYTSMNLALSLAMEIDRTVLAVDIDILKSDLSRLFGAYNRTGLYDYLAHSELDVADIMMHTNVPSLSFIPAGTIRDGITERLASQAMFDLTRELAERYPDRIIIFDAPPVLATSGAAALAPMIGQVVLVVEAYKTTQETLRNALTALDHVPLAGVVLNKIRHRAVGRSYGYGYGYGSPDANKSAAR